MANLSVTTTPADHHQHADLVASETHASVPVAYEPPAHAARRCITEAVVDLIEDLNHRAATQRVDALDNPHKDTAAIRTANDVHRCHSTLIRYTTWLRRALQDGDLEGAQTYTGLITDTAARVAAGLDTLHQVLALGCGHTCPPITTSPGDLERVADDLLDRLAGSSIKFGPAGGVRSRS
jgi:hypothetical protein